VPSIARDRRQDPFEALARCCPSPLAGGQGCRTFLSRVEPRLDPCSLALAGAFKAACALATSASGCFHEHDYGPLEHPRSLEGDWGCSLDSLKVAFRAVEPPTLLRDRGREHRTSALPSEIAPTGDFAPTRMAPGTSCRVNLSFPCPERRGKRGEPPGQRTFARHTLRQGRAAPRLREEGGRSPTRGAFCRESYLFIGRGLFQAQPRLSD
jgi:hypothetical protein